MIKIYMSKTGDFRSYYIEVMELQMGSRPLEWKCNVDEKKSDKNKFDTVVFQ